MAELIIRNAVIDDASQIVALVNAAYRGDSSRSGWTTEADLLEGIRTDYAEVMTILDDQASMILVGIRDTQMVASVHLQKNAEAAFLGMFAVNPCSQGAGIGKQMLVVVEHRARTVWGVRKIQMKVINVRHELIAFYERRGYQRTGVAQEFILPEAMGRAKVSSLKLEVLEKNI
jgi:ribosomal protein S18 acetylase RimI-like enzyme